MLAAGFQGPAPDGHLLAFQGSWCPVLCCFCLCSWLGCSELAGRLAPGDGFGSVGPLSQSTDVLVLTDSRLGSVWARGELPVCRSQASVFLLFSWPGLCQPGRG